MWSALFWGGVAAGSLCIGQLLAGPLEGKSRLIGQVMGFGAGTLLSAVAYELIPESSLQHGLGIAIALGFGAIVYYAGDLVIDRRGGEHRKEIEADESETAGTGLALFLGILLDGIPESFILGITVSLGGSISVAFLVAVFISNIPEGIAGTTALKAAGYSDRRVFTMWSTLTVACAVTAALGFLISDATHVDGLYAQAFAAGAMLTMLADSMMPEAFEHGGRSVGLLTVFGYLVAGILAVA